MKVYHSLSAILADPLPPFPQSLTPILIDHLCMPFHGSIADTDRYWQTMRVSLSVKNSVSTDQIAEYTQRLSAQYNISLYLTGDEGQGFYLLTQHT
jgi:hypothetical protein